MQKLELVYSPKEVSDQSTTFGYLPKIFHGVYYTSKTEGSSNHAVTIKLGKEWVIVTAGGAAVPGATRSCFGPGSLVCYVHVLR